MADTDELRGKVIAAASACADAAYGSAGAAMVKAGLMKDPASGKTLTPDFNTAGSLAAQAAQCASALRDLVDKLDRLPAPTP